MIRKSFLFLLGIMLSTSLFGEVRLPKLISDGVVLQRDTKLPIWGWADAGEKVKVKFNGKTYRTTSNSEGEWEVKLPKMKAGGPYEIIVQGETNQIAIQDILFGDVWLCTGQSNMVHQLDIHDVLYAEEILNANFDQIRHFKVPTTPAVTGPLQDLTGGHWQKAIGEEVRPFSGVAYFFAKQIYLEHGIPIGLINASVGGTPIEAWIPEEGYKNFPEQLEIIQENKDTSFVNPQLRGRSNNWGNQEVKDKGLIGEIKWYEEEYEPKNWRRINIPGYWEDQGLKDLNGTVWYRKEFTLPKSFNSSSAEIHMGRIVDADEVYINGQKVGGRTYKYPQRRYDIPEGLLKEGKNLIVIRVTNFGGKGGFVPDKPYTLFNQTDTIDLKGYWQYKVGEAFPVFDRSQLPKPDENAPRRINAQREPTSLFNGMVAPYTDLPVKGILWYQGESNTGNPSAYLDYQKALIRGMRDVYGNEKLPFIYAQLPGFMDYTYLPVESNWAEFRDVQRLAATEDNSFMTVNIDLGEWNDIHPDNKKDVGERMALVARNMVYCEDIVFSGPLVSEAQFNGNEVLLSFDHVGGGLVTNDGEALSEFAVAGEDGKFIWADEAIIIGNQIKLTSNSISEIVSVRYAWADNPDNPNLYNREGLPASPFQMNQ